MTWPRGSINEQPPDSDNATQNRMEINHDFTLQKSVARKTISGKSHLMNSPIHRRNAFSQVPAHPPPWS